MSRKGKTTQDSGTIYLNKIAVAGRQLNAAIRMFFAHEDELAIHTVLSAAFRILRDLTEHRGRSFSSELYQNGLYAIAKEYAEGTLPGDVLKAFEETPIMPLLVKLADEIRDQGDQFDRSRIKVGVGRDMEVKMWSSKAANFLKHADRDADALLPVSEINNDQMITGACAAYLSLIPQPSPEMIAFHVLMAEHNGIVLKLGPDAQALFAKVKAARGNAARYRLCAKFVRDHRRGHS